MTSQLLLCEAPLVTPSGVSALLSIITLKLADRYITVFLCTTTIGRAKNNHGTYKELLERLTMNC